jgi:hypothetical protein
LFLSQLNAILLEDGVIGAESALRYAKREAGVIDHGIMCCVPLLLRHRDGGASVAAAGFAISSPVVVAAPGVATRRNFGSGHGVDGRNLVAR